MGQLLTKFKKQPPDGNRRTRTRGCFRNPFSNKKNKVSGKKILFSIHINTRYFTIEKIALDFSRSRERCDVGNCKTVYGILKLKEILKTNSYFFFRKSFFTRFCRYWWAKGVVNQFFRFKSNINLEIKGKIEEHIL